jgi:hypothetical protein
MTFLTHEAGDVSRITRRTSTLLPADKATCGYPQLRTFPAVASEQPISNHKPPDDASMMGSKHEKDL